MINLGRGIWAAQLGDRTSTIGELGRRAALCRTIAIRGGAIWVDPLLCRRTLTGWIGRLTGTTRIRRGAIDPGCEPLPLHTTTGGQLRRGAKRGGKKTRGREG